MTLPIEEVLDEIEQHLHRRHELVLEAPPGAGKTTLVPLRLLRCTWRKNKILVFEPRRMAARAAAHRMAELLGEKVGETVGYRVRQDSKISANTLIEVVTGGVLTRLLQDDPALSEYDLVLFDEFHERNLDSDLALTLCLHGRSLLRDDTHPLKLVVMSATLDSQAIVQLLNNAPMVTSHGRAFPVTIVHRNNSPLKQLPEHIVTTVSQALDEFTGDFLVFLPGQKEIHQCSQLLRHRLPRNICIAPLYGNLPLTEQLQAIAPLPTNAEFTRKIVLATDIAETSLTIEGISVVIDSGYRREPVFDPRTGLTRLQTTLISQASATQRAGRAGRLGPGVCIRLFSSATTLSPYAKAEIEHADLAPLVLQLLRFGADNPAELLWLTAPPTGAYTQALSLLARLDATTPPPGPKLTPHGEALAQFPAHPRLAHMMLVGAQYQLLKEASCLAAALTETGRPAHWGDDAEHWLDILLAKSAPSLCQWGRRVKQQQQTFMQNLNNVPATFQRPHCPVGFLLLLAYPDRAARLRGGRRNVYQLTNGRSASLTENSTLFTSEWLAVADTGGTQGYSEDRIFVAARFDPMQLQSHFKHQIRTQAKVEWDEQKNRFIAELHHYFGELCIQTNKLTALPTEQKRQAISAFIQQRGLSVLNWTTSTLQWRARVEFVRNILQGKEPSEGGKEPSAGNKEPSAGNKEPSAGNKEPSAGGKEPSAGDTKNKKPEENWPDLSDAALLNSLDQWLTPFLDSVTTLEDLKKLDLQAILQQQLLWPLPNILNEWAPEDLIVPSGSKVAIDYSQSPPVLAVKLQEMFGCSQTPAIAKGRVTLVVHLLSPARRPLQVTQDLVAFWSGSYQDVKKEMRGRYPKHPWPDDPISAAPTRFTKKHLT